jgi:MarR family transcriptional regulator for hemolysin
MTLLEQVAAVRRTLHRQLTRRLSRQTERPFMQMLALRVIDRGEVRIQAELAERLLVDPPAASRLVERLVKDGLLKRHSAKDRRCVRLEVTAAGQAEAAVLHAELQELDAELRGLLTAQEVRTLRQLLEKLQEGLKETGDALSSAEEEKAE